MIRRAAILLSMFIAACVGQQQGVMHPGGPAAAKIATLNWFVLILFLIVTGVMWVLIVLVATRPKGTFDEHAPVDAGGGQGWVLIGGFLIPAAILAVVFVTGLKAMSSFPVHDGMQMPAEIRITGHQWWWDVRYIEGQIDQRVTTANEIHIPTGRAVDVDLASSDVIHSFWVPELHGKVDLIPSMTNRIRIEADRPGTYRGQCAEYCGAQHAHMMLLVIAEPPDKFQQWLTDQRKPAVAPETDQQKLGQQLFESRPCLLCHTIRGTLANGTVGPDLTHIGSRKRIAANMLENNTANMAAWVTHARALKPGVVMPNVTQFDGDELRAIVAYLQNLQ